MATTAVPTTTRTLMYYFKVVPGFLSSPECEKKLYELAEFTIGPIVSKASHDIPNGDRLYVAIGENNMSCNIRTFNDGNHVTLDAIVHMEDKEEFVQKYALNCARTIEDKLKSHLGSLCVSSRSLYCPVLRGDNLWRYYASSDERLLEFDYDKLVHNSDSKWQNIKILHSKEFGNVLHLDEDVMFGESDRVYMDTLLGIGAERREDYKGKEVLILGGGDGGLIHELVKEKVKMVTMVEIDEEVIKACRKHMRSVCGDTMDEFKGKNHEIIIDDCIKKLIHYKSKGIHFDFVVNDLTEFPVDKANQGYNYDFQSCSMILELSLNVLKPNGKYLARGNCWSGLDYRTQFENDIKTLGAKFEMRARHVPSFHETYCLYEVWK
ncbi:spermine synthase-like isoform X1 [Tubulanus polymorphus]|uniref:spermine synthase-like isoform X1 n=1 Tax=Tubulanus polymorphus TaxID=672921 RepID=UPI003DA5DD1A